MRLPLGVLCALLIQARPIGAVILFGTGDPAANTTPPSGTLTGSGWQYEGMFGAFLGTTIAPSYFITAAHIGGAIGQSFTFNGTNYLTTASFRDPASDLQVWRVAGTFPLYAPLYASASGTEVNLSLVVFGRGTRRGSTVVVGSDSHLGGWLWGAGDALQRWGTNVIGSIEHDSGYGDLLRAPFDSNAGTNEAHLSVGDSGGAVFIYNQSTSRWELAGINLAVDGPFSRSSTGSSPFDAALFDSTGLFVDNGDGTWGTAPNPSAFYATEIAAHRPFINAAVTRLVSAVSRKTHGSAGTFDTDLLQQTGAPTTECRSGGAGNNYQIVFSFASNVSVVSASVTSGIGSVSNFAVSGKQVTVDLTGVTNAQTVALTLYNVNDGTVTDNVSVATRILVGDTTGDATVNSPDISQTKAQSGVAVSATNFREDVTVDGNINSADISLVKSVSGAGLP